MCVIIDRDQSIIFYRPQTKLREGNVFTLVCDSVHRGMCMAGGHMCQGGIHGKGHVWQGACMARGHWWWG